MVLEAIASFEIPPGQDKEGAHFDQSRTGGQCQLAADLAFQAPRLTRSRASPRNRPDSEERAVRLSRVSLTHGRLLGQLRNGRLDFQFGDVQDGFAGFVAE